jgi:hypothetical protein
MWTDRTSMSAPIDLGCEFIHGANASTWDLIRELGLKTRYVPRRHRCRRHGHQHAAVPPGPPSSWRPPGPHRPEGTGRHPARHLRVRSDERRRLPATDADPS